MYQNTNILENKNINIKLNKLKITSFFVNFSRLLMESLGIKPAEKM
jgi:arginyl-tRNA synthetase